MFEETDIHPITVIPVTVRGAHLPSVIPAGVGGYPSEKIDTRKISNDRCRE
jgi:hypothetical protein